MWGAEPLATCTAPVVLKAVMLCSKLVVLSYLGKQRYFKWFHVEAHHLCFQRSYVRVHMAKEWIWTCMLKPSSNTHFLQYELVKEVGREFYWCILFLASNLNQFILLDKAVFKKEEERQPRGMWSILLRMFPLISLNVIYLSSGVYFWWCFLCPSFTSFH